MWIVFSVNCLSRELFQNPYNSSLLLFVVILPVFYVVILSVVQKKLKFRVFGSVFHGHLKSKSQNPLVIDGAQKEISFVPPLAPPPRIEVESMTSPREERVQYPCGLHQCLSRTPWWVQNNILTMGSQFQQYLPQYPSCTFSEILLGPHRHDL